MGLEEQLMMDTNNYAAIVKTGESVPFVMSKKESEQYNNHVNNRYKIKHNINISILLFN
jgi:hypothetical protein